MTTILVFKGMMSRNNIIKSNIVYYKTPNDNEQNTKVSNPVSILCSNNNKKILSLQKTTCDQAYRELCCSHNKLFNKNSSKNSEKCLSYNTKPPLQLLRRVPLPKTQQRKNLANSALECRLRLITSKFLKLLVMTTY